MDYLIQTEPTTSQDWCDVFNAHREIYASDTQRLISYRGDARGNNLFIKDLSNAFATGKDCIGYSVDSADFGHTDLFLRDCKYSAEEAYNRCERAYKAKAENSYSGTIQTPEYTLTVYKREEKGIRTFSPLPQALARLKPLKEIPKKWKLNHVIKMLANGQFSDLETRQRTTDDYAYDAGCNFGKGALNPMILLDDLTSRPSGWWFNDAKIDGDVLGINCHSFDYKNCKVDLNAGSKTALSKATVANITSVEAKRASATPIAGVLMGLCLPKEVELAD